MFDFLFLVLLIAGIAVLAVKFARDKGWEWQAGLAALGTGALGWFTDAADKVASWF